MTKRRTDSFAALRKALETALDHYEKGRLKDAKRAGEKLSRLYPHHPDIDHLLGVVALDEGDFTTATRLISQALKRAPANASAYNNLGNACRALRRHDEAERNYRRAIVLAPRFAAPYCNLGVLHADQGRFDVAIEAFRQSLDLDRTLYDAWIGMSRAYAACGRWDLEAESSREALSIRPGDPTAAHLFVVAAARAGLADESLAMVARIVERQPNSAEALSSCARAYYLLGRYADAAQHYERAVGLPGASAATWNDLGRTRRVLGDFDDAAQCFRGALTLDPTCLDAQRNLALIGRADVGGETLAKLGARSLGPDVTEWDRVLLGFTRGDLLDKSGAYDEAFAEYATANAIQKRLNAARGLNFDRPALRRAVDALDGPEPTPARRVRSQSEAPVFIVGMPRSGTSLVEQILASHSKVFGAGERKALRALRSIDETASLSSGDLEDYLRAWGGDRPGVLRVLDKMPENVFLLDTVASLFPSARIIYCDRDPYDVILSCYFQFFQDSNVFSTDLFDCAEQYVQTTRLGVHWRRVFGDRLATVRYETLVGDLAGESRRLIEFLDLDWEERCLAFHETDRPVATASGWQVRQPLYRTSVGRWRRYERQLPDVRAIVGGDSNGGSPSGESPWI